jgi:hypothetical protein
MALLDKSPMEAKRDELIEIKPEDLMQTNALHLTRNPIHLHDLFLCTSTQKNQPCMKTITISAFFSMILISGFGQNDKNADYLNNLKSFLKACYEDSRENMAIAENMDTLSFSEFKNTLSKDTFSRRVSYDHGLANVVESFIVTKQERAIIDSFFSDTANFRWNDAISPKGSKIISRKVIDSIGYSKTSVGNYVGKCCNTFSLYTLSKPIFLRDYTICIIYVARESDGYGEGAGVIIFKKINGRWIIFKDLEY